MIAFISGLLTVLEAIPALKSMLDTAMKMWADRKIKKLRADNQEAQGARSIVNQRIKKAKTDEDFMSIVRDL